MHLRKARTECLHRCGSADELALFGQEKIGTTWSICKMNMWRASVDNDFGHPSPRNRRSLDRDFEIRNLSHEMLSMLSSC